MHSVAYNEYNYTNEPNFNTNMNEHNPIGNDPFD